MTESGKNRVRMKEKLSYDSEQDVMYFNRGEPAQDSLDIGNVYLEFSGEGKIVGMEVLEASERLNYNECALTMGLQCDIFANIRTRDQQVSGDFFETEPIESKDQETWDKIMTPLSVFS